MPIKDDDKLPKPPIGEEPELEDEFYDDEEGDEDAPERKTPAPAWVKYVRYAVIALIVLVLFITAFNGGCGGRTVQPPAALAQDSVAQPSHKQAPAPPAETPQQTQVQPQMNAVVIGGTAIELQSGDKLMHFSYIVRDDQVKNGESTSAILHADGDMSIELNGTYYRVSNPQTTLRGGEIVAVEYGNTIYTVNEQVAKDLGVYERSPYKEKQRIHRIGSYTIKRGDTAAGIAAAHGMTTKRLAQLNPQYNMNFLIAGYTLKVDIYE